MKNRLFTLEIISFPSSHLHQGYPAHTPNPSPPAASPRHALYDGFDVCTVFQGECKDRPSGQRERVVTGEVECSWPTLNVTVSLHGALIIEKMFRKS